MVSDGLISVTYHFSFSAPHARRSETNNIESFITFNSIHN